LRIGFEENIGPKRDEVTGEWRKLLNEELNDPYSSPNIVRVIKSRRIRVGGDGSAYGEGRGVYGVLGENLRERCHWGDPGVDGRIILGWMDGSGMCGCGLDWAGSG
jgi:hypothetical protein